MATHVHVSREPPKQGKTREMKNWAAYTAKNPGIQLSPISDKDHKNIQVPKHIPSLEKSGIHFYFYFLAAAEK